MCLFPGFATNFVWLGIYHINWDFSDEATYTIYLNLVAINKILDISRLCLKILSLNLWSLASCL